MDFPMPHPGQPQSGINPHLAPPGQQHGPPLHPPLNPLPAPQFQDIPAPPFLPQALHQQYLLQQQILEAQHRHILPPSRWVVLQEHLFAQSLVPLFDYWSLLLFQTWLWLVICLSRRTPERVPHQPHRLRPGYDFAPPLHVPPQPVVQQPRYLAEGTDWWADAQPAGLQSGATVFRLVLLV